MATYLTADTARRLQGATQRSQRLAMLDAMRFVAALAIVLLHTPESSQLSFLSELCAFAVPFFVIAAALFVTLNVERNPKRPFAPFAASRFRRIYVPFFVWSFFYFLIRDAKHLILFRRGAVPLDSSIVIAGSAHHLWFLPFIFFACLLVFLIARFVERVPATRWLVALLFAIAGFVVGVMSSSFTKTLGPFAYLVDRSWAALPGLLWGISFALCYSRIPEKIWRAPLTAIAGGMMFLICVALLLTPLQDHALENLAGFGFFIVALMRWSSPSTDRLAKLGLLAYGIYLCHVAFIEGLQAVAAKLGYVHLWWLDIIVFVLAATASVFFTLVLSRWSWGRWLMAAK